MNDHIEVDYKVYTTAYSALKALHKLPDTIAFDIETRSMYSNAEIQEAKDLLKEDNLSHTDRILCKLVASSSGLSYPSITRITHVNIAWSKSDALVIIISDLTMERTILKWLVSTERMMYIHNSTFDVKSVYVKIGQFIKNYEDTQLLAKCLINHADTWKANTGLKEIMGNYYDPRWTMLDTDGYTNENYKDEAFLRYCAIDSASTYYLWELLQKEIEDA